MVGVPAAVGGRLNEAIFSSAVKLRARHDELIARSFIAWFVVAIPAAAVVLVALFAICVANGYTGVGAWYVVGKNWYSLQIRVGCI